MPKAQRQPDVIPVPRSRALAGWLAVSFVLPFAILLPLLALDVRFGQGYFAYRYSPLRHIRSARSLAVVVPLAPACAGVWLLATRGRRARVAGGGLLAVAMIAAGAWVWWAPPNPATQQFFNARSFSTDGAFVFEAEKLSSISGYLRHFEEVLRMTPEQLGGTRVLSNPPGTTVFAYGLLRAFAPGADADGAGGAGSAKNAGSAESGGEAGAAADGWLERILVEQGVAEPAQAGMVAVTLRFSVALTAVWVLAGAAAYGLGRLFLSPAGAAVFAVVATFNPCTVHFVPGKDPGQLLTINLMLWAWFAGWRRGSLALPAVAGAVFVIGSTFGLVHIWVALVALVATVWQDLNDTRSGRGEVTRAGVDRAARTVDTPSRSVRDAIGGAMRSIGFAALGAIVVVAIVYLATGWNIPATLLAVSARWNELQRTFEMNRAVWYAIGLPIFLLFLSPGVWALGGLALRRPRLNFGTRLALCTLVTMALIYVAMGVTYELPRLWVAFLPTLVLGLAIDSPLLRCEGGMPRRRVAGALLLIVIVQSAFTAFHWTLFDAREAEYRLLSKRLFN